MTDLCDEASAEAECQKSLESAVQHCDSNADAWTAKANFHICQSNPESAMACLDKACSIIEVIENDVWERIFFELDDDAHSGSVTLITKRRYSFNTLVFDKRGNVLDESGLVDLIGKFINDD